MQGEKADGAAYAQQALVKGACAVVARRRRRPAGPLPWGRVADDHAALAALAAVFYGHPSDDLLVVGITGTNGKTTTSYLTAGIFDEGGVRCGRLGTVSYDVGGTERDAPRTTPEASDFQRMLREMASNGCGACAAEVSSHALVLKRVDSRALRRRRLHQPDPRSPRLPRRHGARTSRPSAGCSTCCRRGRPPR